MRRISGGLPCPSAVGTQAEILYAAVTAQIAVPPPEPAGVFGTGTGTLARALAEGAGLGLGYGIGLGILAPHISSTRPAERQGPPRCPGSSVSPSPQACRN